MISLEYYVKIFDGNAEKISHVKKLIISDLKTSEEAFFEADKTKNFAAMKVQLHRMYPIVSNLRYQKLLALITKYQSHQEYADQFADFNIELKKYLLTLYQFLKAD